MGRRPTLGGGRRDIYTGPVVWFRRTRNVGIEETRAVFPPKHPKAGEEYVLQRGEYVEEWPFTLSDDQGELHPFATVANMLQKLSKGWTILRIEGFEEFLRRKDNSEPLVEELIEVKRFCEQRISTHDALAERDREIETLRKRLAEKVGESRNEKGSSVRERQRASGKGTAMDGAGKASSGSAGEATDAAAA